MTLITEDQEIFGLQYPEPLHHQKLDLKLTVSGTTTSATTTSYATASPPRLSKAAGPCPGPAGRRLRRSCGESSKRHKTPSESESTCCPGLPLFAPETAKSRKPRYGELRAPRSSPPARRAAPRLWRPCAAPGRVPRPRRSDRHAETCSTWHLSLWLGASYKAQHLSHSLRPTRMQKPQASLARAEHFFSRWSPNRRQPWPALLRCGEAVLHGATPRRWALRIQVAVERGPGLNATEFQAEH